MDKLDRRHLLGLSAAGFGAVVGCLDSNPEATAENGSDEPDGNGSEGEDGDGDENASGDEDRNGTETAQHPPCPDYGDSVDRVVCYDAIDPETEPTYLEPSARTVEEGTTVEFTLTNDSDETLATNFYNWRVDKYVDGEWYRVAPLGHPDPLMYVEPSEQHTWTVTPDNDGILDSDRIASGGGTEELTLVGVGSGTYAFRARGWFEDSRDDEILAFATTFELESADLTLESTDAIEEVELESGDDIDGDSNDAGDDDGDSADEDSDTLVAHSTRGDSDDEYHRLAAFELEVVDEPSDEGNADPQHVITEQLLRFEQLWDAIALADEHDVSAVRLEEYDATYPVFGRGSDGLYEYQGEYYRVRTRELEE
ncbi:hypothetical protein C483_06115 [Natrialba hulunbeirensis JCM 10989]|uniref:Uncharacterized protein n=1 Tax=Natrialba hulunbeirensis JCM 10989 TaxID=1227493 RepID=M0A4Q0_9EURY|nr:hypothetical protein [Natrialba hulunbeirensis]ELY92887.1 hypothetical protein C483_06115 [Natrialba hulunbeirensis JCM 10989]